MVMPRSRSRSMVSSTCAIISRWRQRAGDFEQAIGKRRFAVIDVRNDAEIPDVRGIHCGMMKLEAGTSIIPRCPRILPIGKDLDARGLKFAIVVARFNGAITEKLLEGAREAFTKRRREEPAGVPRSGSFELPLGGEKAGASAADSTPSSRWAR